MVARPASLALEATPLLDREIGDRDCARQATLGRLERQPGPCPFNAPGDAPVATTSSHGRLADVLHRIADHPASRLDELLPRQGKQNAIQVAAACANRGVGLNLGFYRKSDFFPLLNK